MTVREHHGLSGGATSGWWLANAPSVSAVLPMITAPAATSLSTTVASYSGTQSASTRVPQLVRTPRVAQRSYTAIGTP